ncbi:MAG: hypothetical protein D6731_15690 [Planctomycetota bacterium]|nr:MAG: hypothetical protein D6731_15690 [Planctomycetota bacterium]
MLDEMSGVIDEVLRPADLAQALALLAEGGGRRRPIAGGTDLLVQAKEPGAPPRGLVDLWGLDELRGITAEPDRIVVGANTTMTEVLASELLRAEARCLWDGCYEAGSVQIRNRATLGGNAANASPAADSVLGLIALGAEARIASVRGERRLPVEELATAPRRTALAPDELILAFSFPRAGGRSAFARLGQRRAQAISKVSCAIHAQLDDQGCVQAARVAFGAVAPRVVRSPGAEAALRGHSLTDPSARAAAAVAARADTAPIDDLRSTRAYRSEMVGVLLTRLLVRLAGEA